MTPRTPTIVLPHGLRPVDLLIADAFGGLAMPWLANAVRNVRGMNFLPHGAKLCGRSARSAATTGDREQSSGTASV